jgi:hypothetical protein
MTATRQLFARQVGMNSVGYGYQSPGQRRRYWGIGLVVGLHVLVVWALMSGTARKGLDALKKPIQAVVIQEIIIPPAPPPPPPPKEPRPPEPREPNVTTPVMQPEVPAPEATRPMEALPEPPIAYVKPVAAVPAPITAPAPPVESIKAQAASMEAEYVGKVRTMLNSTKRYPHRSASESATPTGQGQSLVHPGKKWRIARLRRVGLLKLESA